MTPPITPTMTKLATSGTKDGIVIIMEEDYRGANKELQTDAEIIEAIKKLDNGVRNEKNWVKRSKLIKLLKTPYWLR